MTTRRIFYACPDYSPASGGVRRLYRHVEILNKHGIAASILHENPGFAITWFKSEAPVSYRDSLPCLTADDFLVIPETMTPFMKEVMHSPATRAVIALNWSYIYACLPFGESWQSYGINRAIAGSVCEREFIWETMRISAHTLLSGIDANLFHPAAVKRLQIAFMPRKNSMAKSILGAFRSMYPEHAQVRLISICDLAHEQVAQVLSESAIFLTATLMEGLARPPLEAMAAGCVVVGFAGRGSLEYMDHLENCYLAEDCDVPAAAHHLAAAIRSIEAGSAAEMQRTARLTALRYSLENEEEAVLAYWKNILAADRREEIGPDSDFVALSANQPASR